jgi:Uma2 family endonuclease
LAVEIVSSETAAFLERKITLYLETGSQAVWVAYPQHRTLWTHHGDALRRFRKKISTSKNLNCCLAFEFWYRSFSKESEPPNFSSQSADPVR